MAMYIALFTYIYSVYLFLYIPIFSLTIHDFNIYSYHPLV